MSFERTGLYTWKGSPAVLAGHPVAVGDKAPEAILTGADLSDVPLSRWAGKVVVLNVVPSLDTPVCDLQTKRFNREAMEWGDDSVVLTISMDLPFAQKRWCGATGSDRIVTLSDFRLRDFAEKFGLLVKDKGLHARSVFVLDRDGTVRHAQITRDIVEQPDYAAVVATVKTLLGAAAQVAAA